MAREETRRSRQMRRAYDVLNATAERVAAVGIDKTTLDDVARTAGISKSTLYLHWNTREELISALLRRERTALLIDMRERMAAGDSTASPASLYRNFMLGLLDRPLLYPALNHPSELIRGLMNRKRSMPPTDDILRTETHRYLMRMHEKALIRTDRSVRELGNVLHSVIAGALFVSPQIPEQFRLPDRDRADLLADTIDRVLHPGRELSADETAELSRLTHHHLERMQHAAQRKLNLSLGIETPGDPDDEEHTA